MKQYLTRLLFVLTVFITAEFVVQDRVVVYHDELPEIAKSEWVCNNDLPIVHQQSYFDEFSHTHGATPLKAPLAYISFPVYQTFFYLEKLQPTDGYTFVFYLTCKSNIPHLNRDDEDPAFILG
ncbi:hypothetical protein [Aquiflexum sp.]|uniref:hypothetical protein n=1 Tax=Aquiflexum sp. TaxID=1872584 RepID=UPI0035931198